MITKAILSCLTLDMCKCMPESVVLWSVTPKAVKTQFTQE